MQINVYHAVVVDLSMDEVEAGALSRGLQETLSNPASALTSADRTVLGQLLNGLFGKLDPTQGDRQ
ncbi:hypothetical protein ADL27_32345 [Streptomyces sp. NRRL F-6602]|nr:hypothetical protein ADL27_32345 [Streptomyces sp. NRRL F-6602]